MTTGHAQNLTPINAIVLSDIHGSRGGERGYMDDWVDRLALCGYAPQALWLDTLYPEAYGDGPHNQEAVHQRFISGGIDIARERLCQRLAMPGIELVLGFSLGGYLACLNRPALPSSAHIVCISSTRLRLHSQLPGQASIHALFGEEDPYRPDADLDLGAPFYHHLLRSAGHSIYHQPERCTFVLNALARGARHTGSLPCCGSVTTE